MQKKKTSIWSSSKIFRHSNLSFLIFSSPQSSHRANNPVDVRHEEYFDRAANLEGNVPTSTFIALCFHTGGDPVSEQTSINSFWKRASLPPFWKERREATSPPCTIDKSIGRNCTKLIKLLDGPWRSLTVNESWSVTLRPEHTRWQIVIGVTKRAFHP